MWNTKLIFKKDGRGNLYVGEARKQIPFAIKRFYIISNVVSPKVVRGMHAHKKLEQAIFCLNGSFELSMDDGRKKWSIFMNNPAKGVLLRKKVWHSMSKFSKDCVTLVVASDYYNEDDYIRNYDEFSKLI
ncbi:MAG: WxcM-like protein [Candidatus Giovannonibacteria bacterium GW2011_GWC2_44_9]|uniref:WxcM-like protein n=3 Tax=Candidatus Giovannoniibacteriota TaxID=1752738 RepID=A0A0G1L6N4_9BACT|nr:MAG: WxcM-like protein [Candidatus Giovannonibacteria bacterium GW2011_GWB1_44_23]KKT64312.1 MAG: WxcM-like protein [Candidatus Giovannonibacteria bacterium GW2011_GWA1_44_29]KKT84266.1 MAG: WxcM-like protein [Candidatus Giovannonibacteria bacterium GW2011_GWC2_44_9]KKT92039.1 MAG: WxcM-like protein [Parcubacteria group bacterium GW2011_GWC1_45_13]